MYSRALLAGLILALTPLGATAQDWREVTSFRQRSDEARLDIHVRYGAGELLIRPGEPGELYRVNLRYDADIFEPVTRYDAGELEVGIEGRGRNLKLRNAESGELRLQLTPELPMELDLDFGAAEADLELGGLRIRSLDVETGASDTEIRFDAPNPEVCDRLEIAMGAAAFEVRGLGNAGCSEVKAEGGVGDLTLDFEGAWPRDIHTELTMALGSVTLVVPDDIGVRVEKETFLTDFDRSGFSKRGDAYYSSNWDSAGRRLTVELEGAFGSISVRWAPPTSAMTR